ncbi:hypothetical protein AQ505_11805 [Pedobacter sp. PACM 27299]|nr:hypothetical protein AQ505_11805 [Pedobacter sp. PACM 27299]
MLTTKAVKIIRLMRIIFYLLLYLQMNFTTIYCYNSNYGNVIFGIFKKFRITPELLEKVGIIF